MAAGALGGVGLRQLGKANDTRLERRVGVLAATVLLVALVAGPLVSWDIPLAAVGFVVLVVACFFAATIGEANKSWNPADPKGDKTILWLLCATSVIGVLAVLGGLMGSAANARDDFAEGRRPTGLGFGFSGPWDAEVVRVTWGEKPPSQALALPRCLLYLGHDAGTSLFFDPTDGHERTLRLQASTLQVEVLPHTESALPAPGNQPGPCS